MTAQPPSPSGRLPAPAARARTEGYAVPRPAHDIDLWLDLNEGRLHADLLARALESVAPDDARRYPSDANLTRRFAECFSVSPDRVLVTAGGDDALSRACLAYLEHGRDFILPSPSFEMLSRYAELAGARVVRTDWSAGPYPLDAVLERITPSTGAIAVVSPNNPTGGVISAARLRELSAAAPHAMLLVDLAYTEFADEDLTPVAAELPNTIIVRTLSKAWGLAGLRIGCAIAQPESINALRSVGNPFAASSLSLRIAGAFLDEPRQPFADMIARVRTERAQLRELLTSLGVRVEPSQGNFVLARFPPTAPHAPERVWRGLAERGIAIRLFKNRPGLEDALRITCPADASGFSRLTDALSAVIPAALQESRA